jgi:hypothetical protein
MKARVPNKTMIANERDKAQTDAIKLCVVTGIAADVDCGFAESTLEKKYKKAVAPEILRLTDELMK